MLQDVIQQLANFNNSLLSIPNNPWSSVNGPSAGNYWNLTPVQTYIWYHNTFAMVTPLPNAAMADYPLMF